MICFQFPIVFVVTWFDKHLLFFTRYKANETTFKSFTLTTYPRLDPYSSNISRNVETTDKMVIIDCEHTKDSMFSIGPCDSCREKCNSMESNGKEQSSRRCRTCRRNTRHQRVQFADKSDDEHASSQSDSDTEQTIAKEKSKGPKPILKHRVNCVVIVYEK